jgi:hypothetical protein
MKNSLVQLAIAVIAVNAVSQIPALATEQKPVTMYVLGSNAPLPTRPNREMLGALPLPTETTTEAMAPSIVASQPDSNVVLRAPIVVTTAKGW